MGCIWQSPPSHNVWAKAWRSVPCEHLREEHCVQNERPVHWKFLRHVKHQDREQGEEEGSNRRLDYVRLCKLLQRPSVFYQVWSGEPLDRDITRSVVNSESWWRPLCAARRKSRTLSKLSSVLISPVCSSVNLLFTQISPLLLNPQGQTPAC